MVGYGYGNLMKPETLNPKPSLVCKDGEVVVRSSDCAVHLRQDKPGIDCRP